MEIVATGMKGWDPNKLYSLVTIYV